MGMRSHQTQLKEERRKLMSSEQTVVRKEAFGSYTVVGKKGVDDLGNTGWEITTYFQNDIGHHDYWVCQGTFHLMRVAAPVNGGTQQMEILRATNLVAPQESRAVLRAIERWERPIQKT
jgi:hypothetical protein